MAAMNFISRSCLAEEEEDLRSNDREFLDANVVLQVHRSHLSRIEDLISDSFQTPDHDDDVHLLTSKKCTISKTCSLVFLHVTNIKQFSEWLSNSKFVFQGLNKSYVLQSNRALVRCSIDEDSNAIDHFTRVIHQRNIPKMVVKIDTFPPTIQCAVVTKLLQNLDQRNIPRDELDIAPKNHTHTLNIVQVQKKEKDTPETFLIGLSSVESSIPPIHKTKEVNDDVCRAHYKLDEAFLRYKNYHKNNGWPWRNETSAGSKRKRQFKLLGVDCGAAPGGWTKYLIEQSACDEVYSIDPGKLSDSVLSLPGVSHLQMTGQDALPKLKDVIEKQGTPVSIWVSDMCVHDISKQVDMILLAKTKGILQPDAAFVLTIKCNVGHAKKRFDDLTEKEVARLREAGAYDVMVVHLFSNRIGERTVIGFIQ